MTGEPVYRDGSVIDATGWLLIALVAVVLVIGVWWCLCRMVVEWAEPDDDPPLEQPRGFRIIGPVVRPPFDWRDWPEFCDGAWSPDTRPAPIDVNDRDAVQRFERDLLIHGEAHVVRPVPELPA